MLNKVDRSSKDIIFNGLGFAFFYCLPELVEGGFDKLNLTGILLLYFEVSKIEKVCLYFLSGNPEYHV